MKSALECFQHAAKCEEQAKQAISDAGRAVRVQPLAVDVRIGWHRAAARHPATSVDVCLG
jgi:hypothetical protein